MQSIRELYRVGVGPSASHTMGPKKAAEKYLAQNPGETCYQVELYGSLAATGIGHMTDEVLKSVFKGLGFEIIWKPEEELSEHPNGMIFASGPDVKNLGSIWKVYSVGGGEIVEHGQKNESPFLYHHRSLGEIIRYCKDEDLNYWEYVIAIEGEDAFGFLSDIWKVMEDAVELGLKGDGYLPGNLKVKKKAAQYHRQAKLHGNAELQKTALVSAYALAVSELNASGGTVVTAPTCGACGVLPGVLSYFYLEKAYPLKMILKALATASLIGNLAKENASISGAEVGCQGEVGVACAMAAAASCQLLGGSMEQIEYAAEMAIEHHLGLTCDPVEGLVQIPCIERNAIAASRALDCAHYALLSEGDHKISFDQALETLKATGLDMLKNYKETSKGGLAKIYAMRNYCS